MDANVLFRAIKAKCIECSGGSREEAAKCKIKSCPLYPWRLGDPQKSLIPENEVNEPPGSGK